VAFYEGLRKALRRLMDYIAAGLVSLALCIYLLYALLRPEKF
jgi:K+-transporting ATPase KdpF subunit